MNEAIELAIQTTRGLAAAHEKGIVHRDMKSSNLMVTQPGPDTERLLKIMDFGLAGIPRRGTGGRRGACRLSNENRRR